MKPHFKLACSNLAWPPGDDERALHELASQGFSGIEIAPTRVWPNWRGANQEAAKEHRKRLADAGFSIPAMQAIFYGLGDLNLFAHASFEPLIKHTIKVSMIAEALECPVMVFGAPKMRDPRGIHEDHVLDRAISALTAMAKIAHDHGTTLCIEPNARDYGCGFVWTGRQGAEVVQAVNHPGFGLHLDAAAMHLEGEDSLMSIHNLASRVLHFHVSEPGLCGLAEPRVDHLANLRALAASGYDRWVSLESTEAPAFDISISKLSSWANQC